MDELTKEEKEALLFLFYLIVMPLVMMLLWNILMVDIFGLSKISYLQALGLRILSSTLFNFDLISK